MASFLKPAYAEIMIPVILLFYCLICTRIAEALEPNRCIIDERKNISGICKPLTNCSSSIGLLRAGIAPEFCKLSGSGIEGNVCCRVGKRISVTKCEEFSTVLMQPVKAKSALVYDGSSSQPDLQDKTIKCEDYTMVLISGGRMAHEREYPHQVALGFGDKANPSWKCGGTLIDRQYIVTAGHCILTIYGPPKVVLLGDVQLAKQNDSPSRTIMEISEIYVHPLYKPPLQYNDIAIIKLKTPTNMSRSILPACLPDPADRLDRNLGVEATGWGQTGAMDGQSDMLQTVSLTKFDTKECSDFYSNKAANKERLPHGILRSQFCAGDKVGIGDTCKGDSGGPLTMTKENSSCIHYLVGITSFGSNLCGFQQPGVYTNVLSYLDWIEDIVWFNSTVGSGNSRLYTKITPGSDELLQFKPTKENTSKASSTKPTVQPTSKSTTPLSTTTTTRVTTTASVPPTTTTVSTTVGNFQQLFPDFNKWAPFPWRNTTNNILNIPNEINQLFHRYSTGK